MADIQYNITNNNCFGNSLGRIAISQINFTSPSELTSFASYNIAWSGDFYSNNQISDDGRIAELLNNGNYSFSIQSLVNNSVLGPYNIEITSPPELKIVDVKYNRYSCEPNDTSIVAYISGGTPPYILAGGPGASEPVFSNIIAITGLNPNTYSLSVTDNNDCSYTWPNSIEIKNSALSMDTIEIVSPTLLDSYGIVKLRVNGYGPFNFWFENKDTGNIVYIDSFATEYITNAAPTYYEYRISDKLTPGNYTVTIKNNYGCSLIDSLSIPNIQPMSVICGIINNDLTKTYDAQLTLPIFDTILIPYKHIQSNSSLWQFIKNLSLKDTIQIQINENIKDYKIVRNMLDKYCLDENKVEILRLGNDSDDWFFYFYIAPSINLNDDFEIVNAKFNIFNPNTNENFDLILGLNEYNTIDTEKPSLIRGSFILPGLDHSQFVNKLSFNVQNQKNNAYISLDDENLEEYSFVVKNISKFILKNTYVAGYVTTINFLEQFNKLNIYVNISDTACNSTIDDYQYLLSIKEVLKAINNLDNILNVYIYNLDNINNIGQIILSIGANPTFVLENGELLTNQYNISYYTFDDESSKPKMFYINNAPANDTSLQNLDNGYIIIRIKDIYNNIPRNISYNNININYDTHFAIAKNIIQKFNKNITPYFEYGDILVYITSTTNPAPPVDDPIIPKPPVVVPPAPPVIEDNIVYQTPDTSNTSTLIITKFKNIKCILKGPKNYHYMITKNITEIRNMVPGVYTIVGDIEELNNNYLYQQEHRILIEKNTSNTIDIDFVSYQDKTFIKDI